ncbi:MAPEG family protein [Thalassospira australica]|uniref:MAPEG family protein n=1 Tax=Thalassospira australica TaxID=1528106 RepID=UPI00051A7F9E|nr:MAPEG family protein [Thalassospira australica]
MLPLPVTIFTTGVFALMLTTLDLLVSLRRRDLKLLMGDGDDMSLRRRIRAHGNFIENAPMIILLVLALEAVLATSNLVWPVAVILIISRLLHAIGAISGNPRLIFPAMLSQHAIFVICGIWLLIQTLSLLAQAA